jgi:hypothetical protein
MLIVVLFVCTYHCICQNIYSKYFYMNNKDWGKIDSARTTYTPETLLEEADYYYNNEYYYLNNAEPRESVKKVCINLVPEQDVGSENWVIDGRMYINADSVSNSRPFLAHEISHLLYSSSALHSYSEGLAEYLYCRYTKISELSQYYRIPVFQRTKAYWKYLYDKKTIESIWNGRIDGLFYLQAESMVTYLIETFGIGKTMEYLHGDGYKSFDEIFGIELQDAIEDWERCIDNQEDNEYCLELFGKPYAKSLNQ